MTEHQIQTLSLEMESPAIASPNVRLSSHHSSTIARATAAAAGVDVAIASG